MDMPEPVTIPEHPHTLSPEAQNGQPVEPGMTTEQMLSRIGELERYIALQMNTIAAFQHRCYKLEMEIVELMSQLPQSYQSTPLPIQEG